MQRDARILETDRAARTTLPPARSYLLPGGPYTDSLGQIEVVKLAEIERGGPHDFAR